MTKLILTLWILTLFFTFSCQKDSGGEQDKNGTGDALTKLEIQNESEDNLFLAADDPESGISESLNDDKVIAYAYVEMNISADEIVNLEKGTVLTIPLDQNLNIDAEVQRVQEILELTSVSATVLSPYDGQVALTIENGHLRGSITLYNPDRYFQIRYHSGAEAHYIAEIDWQKIDILPGSPPVNPMPINPDD